MYPWWKFQQDWTKNKGFSLGAPYRGSPGPLRGVGVHISHFYAKSFNNFLICSPGENFSKIGPKIRDLAMSSPGGTPMAPAGPPGVQSQIWPNGAWQLAKMLPWWKFEGASSKSKKLMSVIRFWWQTEEIKMKSFKSPVLKIPGVEPRVISSNQHSRRLSS